MTFQTRLEQARLRFRLSWLVLVLGAGCLSACAPTPEPAPAIEPQVSQAPPALTAEVSLEPPRVLAPATEPVTVPGGVMALAVPPDTTAVTYNDRPVFLIDGVALIGVDIKANVGTHEASVTRTDGTQAKVLFEVQGKDYPEQRITLANPNLVTPPAETLKRIRAESALMREAYAHFTELSEAPAPFVQPLTGIRTSPFGRKRFFNDKPRNPHSGLDLAAPTGTPIHSPAPGTVVLTGHFYFNGISAFVDHGGGLISMMCHMSEVLVEEGDRVERGDVLGLVGTTGRSTGPHLHWTVKLNRNAVDPEQVMALFGSPLVLPPPAPTPPKAG